MRSASARDARSSRLCAIARSEAIPRLLKYGLAPVRGRHAHGDALVAALRARLDVADAESA
jgi:hypothetical protein